MTDDEKKPMTPANEASSTSYPFDRVVVEEGAHRKNLSPAEFFALPLAQRIQYVVQQKAAFFASGQPVDSKEALGQMRRLRAQLH
jgi:hypothetical protein